MYPSSTEKFHHKLDCVLFFKLCKKPRSGFIIITAGESRSYLDHTNDNRKAVAQKGYRKIIVGELFISEPPPGFFGGFFNYPVILTGLLLFIRLRRKSLVKNLIVVFLLTIQKPRSGFIIITAGESRSYLGHTNDNRKAVAQKNT